MPVGSLDITMFRDDLRMRPARGLGRTELPAGGIDDAIVVLVDDVLFSGRSIRAALDALERARPAPRGAARRAGRPRPPPAADPRRLRRQEPADVHAARPCRCSLDEIDGRDAVVIGRRGRPDAASQRGSGMTRHLLSAGDLIARRRDRSSSTPPTSSPGSPDRPVKKLPTLRGRTVVNLFFEDSTRTRISFEAAAKRLSADVINFSAKGSSVSKGESLKDTALTLEAMGADAVVIRHGASGAPHTLAHSGWIGGSVVNAGDGTHEHPTQALLDAFTMRRHLDHARGTLDRHRRRRAAQPGGSVQRAAAVDPRCRRSRWSPRRRCCRSGVEAWPCEPLLRPRRRARRTPTRS